MSGLDICTLAGFHLFTKWSKPEHSGSGRWYQSRACMQCNLAEMRIVEVVQ